MSNKKVAELYRQLANKLDEIDVLNEINSTQKDVIETNEEQLRVADMQIQLAKSEVEEWKTKAESFRQMALQWRELSQTRTELVSRIDSLFNAYTSEDFNALEAMALESKGYITPDNFETESEYIDEQEYVENVLMLVEEIKTIKGEFFNGSEGEEDDIDEQLAEF